MPYQLFHSDHPELSDKWFHRPEDLEIPFMTFFSEPLAPYGVHAVLHIEGNQTRVRYLNSNVQNLFFAGELIFRVDEKGDISGPFVVNEFSSKFGGSVVTRFHMTQEIIPAHQCFRDQRSALAESLKIKTDANFLRAANQIYDYADKFIINKTKSYNTKYIKKHYDTKSYNTKYIKKYYDTKYF